MDTNVHAVMWQPLLTFLRGVTYSMYLISLTPVTTDHPSCWVVDSVREAEGDENDESSEEEGGKSEKPAHRMTYSTSSAYREFLSFLGSGCAGSPIQGYPAVLVILSTIPQNVRPKSTGSSSTQPHSQILLSSSLPTSDLFTAMWEAVNSRALSSLQRSTASAAFLSSLVECVIFLTKRLYKEREPMGDVSLSTEDSQATALRIVEEEIGRIWDSLCSNRLKVDEVTSTNLLGKLLVSLHNGPEGEKSSLSLAM